MSANLISQRVEQWEWNHMPGPVVARLQPNAASLVLGCQELRVNIGDYMMWGSRGEALLIGLISWAWRRDNRFRMQLLAWIIQAEHEDSQRRADVLRGQLVDLQLMYQQMTQEPLPRYWARSLDGRRIEPTWAPPLRDAHPRTEYGSPGVARPRGMHPRPPTPLP